MAEQQLIVQRSLEGMTDAQYVIALMEMINVMNPVSLRAQLHEKTSEFFEEEDKTAIAHVEESFRTGNLHEMMRTSAGVVETFEMIVEAFEFDLRQLNADGVETEDGNDIVTIEVWGVPRG